MDYWACAFRQTADCLMSWANPWAMAAGLGGGGPHLAVWRHIPSARSLSSVNLLLSDYYHVIKDQIQVNRFPGCRTRSFLKKISSFFFSPLVISPLVPAALLAALLSRSLTPQPPPYLPFPLLLSSLPRLCSLPSARACTQLSSLLRAR